MTLTTSEFVELLKRFCIQNRIAYQEKRLLQADAVPCCDIIGISHGGTIQIRTNLGVYSLPRAWVHEVAHELLLPRDREERSIRYKYGKKWHEHAADHAAFLVMRHFNIPQMFFFVEPPCKRVRQVAQTLINYIDTHRVR